MEVCNSFLCKCNIDDFCNDHVLCGDCLYCDCEHCVYYSRVNDFAEYCVLQDGCGCGEAFSP